MDEQRYGGINLELYKLKAHEISDMLRNKEITASEVTEAVFNNIDKVENKVNAYISIDRDYAINRAKNIDKRIQSGEKLPALAGVPMAVKDNICTKDMKTTCASRMLENFYPPYDASVIKQINDNCGVIIGKSNMDEFAMGSSTENSAVKQTKNPWDLNRVPGGSSGGSAAIVAADEAYYALGSDTGGSIRQPASFCGVVGMKPTYGAVSRYGLIAYASSLDQIGPVTKDVTDCALVLNVIMGHDSMDSTSVDGSYPDYTKALGKDIKNMKIGIPKEYFGEGINIEVKNKVEEAVKLLNGLGAEYEEFSQPYTEYALSAYYIISSAEASSNLARYDGVKYGYRCKEYADIVDMYNKTRNEGFGKEVKRRIILGTYALSSGYYDDYYLKALKVRTLIKQSFNDAFKKYDVIITPTSPNTCFKIGEKAEDPLEMYLQDICTITVNIAGLPALSIPCGFDSSGLPVGMQLIGRPFQEHELLKMAYTYEKSTDFHQQKPDMELNGLRGESYGL